jgi:hypothetical protein
VKEEMQNSQTWRELLGKIIQDPRERARLAAELGVHSLTLTRWVNGDASPRPHNLQSLIRALPQYRNLLLELVPKEFGQIVSETTVKDDVQQEIPSAFYARIFHALSELPDPMRSWSICDLVLQQALQQLDPNRVGMEITVMHCMLPPLEQKVLSLRETLGRGTPPWTRELQQKTMFLGAESLAGYAVTTGRPVAIQTREEGQSRFPARWVEREESAAAHPIRRGGRIAGCLLFSSTQPNYFLPFRLALIESYTELIALAFEREEFYDFAQIELGIMPAIEKQQPYFSAFSRRVTDMVREASRNQQPISIIEAEQMVWKQIETELLSLAPTEEA